jgi:hypothetical protein
MTTKGPLIRCKIVAKSGFSSVVLVMAGLSGLDGLSVLPPTDRRALAFHRKTREFRRL